MSRSYVGTKTAFTGGMKLRVMAAMFQGAKLHVKAEQLKRDDRGLYPVNSITWEELRAYRQQIGQLEYVADGPEWSVAAAPMGP